MQKSALFLLLALAAGGGVLLWPKLFPTPLDRFATACEGTLKERLRSPKTYSRVLVEHFPLAEQTLDQFLSLDSEEERQRYMRLVRTNSSVQKSHDLMVDYFDKVHPKRLRALITYDAANAYGTPIRGFAECTTSIQTDLDFSAETFGGVSVNGQTSIEWALRGGN